MNSTGESKEKTNHKNAFHKLKLEIHANRSKRNSKLAKTNETVIWNLCVTKNLLKII